MTASTLAVDTTPAVSVTVMSETEVAALSATETQTTSADNETSTASADCILVGNGEASSETATAASTTGDIATPSNATSMSNMTSTDNTTGTEDATPTSFLGSNGTSVASASESDQILVIDGKDFLPGEAVLMFSEEGALVGIDDVDENGEIEAKIPIPETGETAVAGDETDALELRLLESGTQRATTFEFDGETLTETAGGEIEAEGSGATPMTSPAPSDDATNNTSITNSTSIENSSDAIPLY